ncbi:hypothetical protein NADFUDRAFT_50558 [Nadsonia fulvescens var. elongata DSM 6958]|uniref:Large ribosomal subunit protein mL50 n=1 Tax=Nadsonia fulvescens var. elongata DSM 6958 TaxID=857566 RepID=A0A1E3PP68_9ASCO|nr:hypothetical protein NADFUDRAFT_50558 [Nadsonia fulvescens var. elongata DSM 6958]
MIKAAISRPYTLAFSLIARNPIILHNTTQRRIHLSRTNRDLLTWFTGKKAFDPEDETKVVNTKKTDDYISEVEESGQKTKTQDENLAVDLEVIGEPAKVDTWRYEMNGFKIKQWKNKPENRLALRNQVEAEAAVKASFKGITKKDQAAEISLDYQLDDLLQRFNFVKSFTIQTGVTIPDHILSKVQTPRDLVRYLNSSVIGVNFDEKSPKAIFLDQKDWEGTNVTIIDTDKERKIKNDNWKELVRKAKELDSKVNQSKIEAALNQ